MGVYDHSMKVIVDANPEAIVQFVLCQWSLAQGIAFQIDMFEELRTNRLNDLMLPGQIIAGWLLLGGDLEWLKKEYAKMSSIFEDSPVIEWIKEDAFEKAFKKAREQVNRELSEERQRVLEERQRAVEAERRALEGFRQALVAIVSGYYPKLARLAEKQVRLVEDQERLQRAIRRISTLRDAKEVKGVLLDLDEDEDEE